MSTTEEASPTQKRPFNFLPITIIFVIISIVLGIGIVAFGIYHFYSIGECSESEIIGFTNCEDCPCPNDQNQDQAPYNSDTEADIEYRTPSEVDTSDWETYTHSTHDISFRHPPDWTVSEDCEEGVLDIDICGIETTEGSYIWTLDVDPYVTGGGYGFLFDMMGEASSITHTPMEIDGYEATMVTYFYDSEDLQEAMPSHSIPPTGEIWGWSTLFSDPDDMLLGFGPGVMYDEVPNNTWVV